MPSPFTFTTLARLPIRSRGLDILKVGLIYLGMVGALLSYEYFNKHHYARPPIVMQGWLDEKISIIPIFVVPYLSFHVLALFVVPILSYKFGGMKAFLVNGISIMLSQAVLDVAYIFFKLKYLVELSAITVFLIGSWFTSFMGTTNH